MTYEQLAKAAEQAGFSSWVPLDTSTIILKQEVRDMCAVNSCGKYGKCWSCPPGCGTLTECRTRIREYSYGILVQTWGRIEDGFDFEGMQKIEADHKSNFLKMFEFLRNSESSILALGSGCCTQCAVCTYPSDPCRFPDKMVSSMEAYGMLVSDICKSNHLKYYYGPNTIAFTGCFLV